MQLTITKGKMSVSHSPTEGQFTQSRKPTANRILIRNLEYSTMVTTCQPLHFFSLQKRTKSSEFKWLPRSQLGEMGSNTIFFVHLCNSALTNKIQHDWGLTEIVRGLFTLFISPLSHLVIEILTPHNTSPIRKRKVKQSHGDPSWSGFKKEPRFQLSCIFHTQAAKARQCDKIRTGFTELGLTPPSSCMTREVS